MKRSILIGICALLGVVPAAAQTYVVDGLYRDCAKASEHAPGESLMSRLSISAAFGEKEKEAMLPNGTEVQLLSDQARRMVKVQYEGETWWMDARELRFAESNPPGTVDVLAGLDFSPAPMEMHLADDTVAYANTMERGTAEWAFLHSLVPPVLILLLGHCLNLAMSCLGAFVHPLRLTFVEYFKNSGYEGRGAAYNPLARQ